MSEIRLITDKEVARMYGVTPKCIWNWARLGRIPKPHVQSPNFSRWLLSDIEQHILNMNKAEKMEKVA